MNDDAANRTTTTATQDDTTPWLLTDGGEPDTTLPLLPPPEETPTRVLAVSGAAVAQYHVETILEMIDAVGADVLVATNPQANIVGPTLARQVDIEILEVGTGMQPDATSFGEDRLLAVALPMGGDQIEPAHVSRQLDAPARKPHSNIEEAVTRLCLIGDDVSLSVEPSERTTSLEGIAAYRLRIPDQWWGENVIHLSTKLRSGFKTTWHSTDGPPSGAQFIGIGTANADLGAGSAGSATQATVVELYSNGAVAVSEVDPEQFGLRGIHGVGETRIKTLRQATITSAAALAEASLKEVAALPGMGQRSARRIQTRAKSRTATSVLPTGDDPLPDQEPVFIDIETDGLNPSTAWLIGVLDGGPEDGQYMSFREQQPGEPTHLEAFMTWLTGAVKGRPIVAWNGYGFDFPVIKEQLQEQYPELVSKWNNRYQFDALWWATDKNGGNAALPGRTNKLEHVAQALGWEPSTTGIDGATVAKLYTAYRTQVTTASDPAAIQEPDWARLEQYCEDDVRALATIYEHLREAARQDSAVTTPTGENSSQGSLADFS